MIKVSMNGFVVSLEDKKQCSLKDMEELIMMLNNAYRTYIEIEEYSEEENILILLLENKRYIIILDNITQYNIYRYICDNILEVKTLISVDSLLKVQEKFKKSYNMDEMLTSGEYWAFKNMLKFIDLLIEEVK